MINAILPSITITVYRVYVTDEEEEEDRRMATLNPSTSDSKSTSSDHVSSSSCSSGSHHSSIGRVKAADEAKVNRSLGQHHSTSPPPPPVPPHSGLLDANSRSRSGTPMLQQVSHVILRDPPRTSQLPHRAIVISQSNCCFHSSFDNQLINH